MTGASGGIGGAIVSELLERGADVIGACRRPQRLPEHPRLRGLELDLASFASVRRAAGMLEGERIYGIVSNAGIMPVRETVITADGLERTYQVNYEATRMFAGCFCRRCSREVWWCLRVRWPERCRGISTMRPDGPRGPLTRGAGLWPTGVRSCCCGN